MTKLVGVIAGCALVLAACGDDGATDSEPEPTGTTEPTTTEPTATTEPVTTEPTTPEPTTVDPATTVAAVPEGDVPDRIVSLSPIATEMIFAIGAEDLLVAVDDFSYYPAEALELPHDLSAYEPNVEAIAGYEPDLVLISGDFTGLGDQLTSIGIEYWDGPAAITLDDTYAQIEQLGAITEHVGEAAELVSRMQTDIDAIVASAPTLDAPLTYYHELGPDLYSATSSTFIGQLYSLIGLENIADAADEDGSGYPQLNAEYIVQANPDLVFLSDTKCCDVTAASVAERPGWDQIAAVQNDGVVEMDDDIASRWGPRVVDYLQAVVDAVAAVPVDA
jgi:iron complex transport system substrate-binding protein